MTASPPPPSEFLIHLNKYLYQLISNFFQPLLHLLSSTLFESIKMSFLNFVILHTPKYVTEVENFTFCPVYAYPLTASWDNGWAKEVWDDERWKWFVLTRSHWNNETTFQRLGTGLVANIIVGRLELVILGWDVSSGPFNGVLDIKWFFLPCLDTVDFSIRSLTEVY